MIDKSILSVLLLICICISPVIATTVTTGAVSINSTMGPDCAIFNGYYNGTVPAHVWFEYGLNQTNSFKSYRTPNQTKATTGNFTFRQCGIPLLTNTQYIVQAFGEDAYGENQSFTMPGPVPHAAMTYDIMVNQFVGSNEYSNDAPDPLKLVSVDIWQVYTGLIGGLFFAIIIGFIAMNIALKQKTTSVSLIIFIITGVSILPLLPPQVNQLAYLFVILSVAEVFYWIFVKRR